MKDASSQPVSGTVTQTDRPILRRLRPEPTPTLAGTHDRPWRPLPATLDAVLAARRSSPLVRRAHDPTGWGWERVRPAISNLPIAAPQVAKAPVKPRSRKRPLVPPLVPGDIGADSILGGERLNDIPLLVQTVEGEPCEAESASVGVADPSVLVLASRRLRRIELIPGAPALPRILFTGDKPEDVPERNDPVEIVPAAQEPPAARPAMNEVDPTPVLASETGVEVEAEVRLTARDPFMVVAHWDRDSAKPVTAEEEWGRGRWWMRLHEGSVDGPVVTERPAHETAGTVLLPVIDPGRSYVAELGYDSHRSGWHGVAISHPTPTPRDRPASQPPTGEPIQWSKPVPWEGEPGVAQAAGDVPSLPAGNPEWIDGANDIEAFVPSSEVSGSPLDWSWAWWRGDAHGSSGDLSGRESKAGTDGNRRVRSVEKLRERAIGEMLRSVASEALAEILPSATGCGFWFRLNAEVILHGSTEPDARVTIAGRSVVLRPDGSFSFRFAFPDGDFRLPVEAISADGQDGRKASVRFLRSTGFEGEVGEHPVSPAWDADLGEWGK